MNVKPLSCVWLFATPWIIAYQAPPSMGFSRQEYWSGLPFSSPGDLPNPGIEPGSPIFQADALTSLRLLLFPSFSRWESLNSEGLCSPWLTNRVDDAKVYAEAQRHERGSMEREQVACVTAPYVMIGTLDLNLEDLIHSLRKKVIKRGSRSWVPSFHRVKSRWET